MSVEPTRRQHPRVSVRQPMEFAVTMPFEGATMKTIGSGGLCFVTNKPVEIGTRLLLRFGIPGGTEPMNAVGVTVWAKAIRTQRAEVGIKFIGLREDNLDRLKKFCAIEGVM